MTKRIHPHLSYQGKDKSVIHSNGVGMPESIFDACLAILKNCFPQLLSLMASVKHKANFHRSDKKFIQPVKSRDSYCLLTNYDVTALAATVKAARTEETEPPAEQPTKGTPSEKVKNTKQNKPHAIESKTYLY